MFPGTNSALGGKSDLKTVVVGSGFHSQWQRSSDLATAATPDLIHIIQKLIVLDSTELISASLFYVPCFQTYCVFTDKFTIAIVS